MKRSALIAVSGLLSLAAMPACSSTPKEESGQQSARITDGEWEAAKKEFCPKDLVPRRDMAKYLERLKRGRDFVPPPPQNIFGDVPRDSQEAAWIEQLAADGITKGTGPGTFSPNDTVPREQMAAFIIRLLHGPDFQRSGPSRFVDVTNPDFVGAIEQLADDGITKGCTATEFCPGDMVPREQMAAFLMRAVHPGTADPPSSGRFSDLTSDNSLAGRAEQAMDEGIMEPCGSRTDNLEIGRSGGVPGTLVFNVPRNVSDYWTHVETRVDGAEWTPALCPAFNPFGLDVWLHVSSSDDDGMSIAEVMVGFHPDNGGAGSVTPWLSLFDTRGTSTDVFTQQVGQELHDGDFATFGAYTRFNGPSVAGEGLKVLGTNTMQNGNCGFFLPMMMRLTN